MAVPAVDAATGRRAGVNREQLKSRALDLSADALGAYMGGDIPGAAAAIQAVSDETGSEGVGWMLVAWCDTLIEVQARARGGVRRPVLAAPSWVDCDGHATGDAASVPAPVRWAGQLVAARAAGDNEMVRALLTSMPGDARERGQFAKALLHACAASVRMFWAAR